MVADIGYQGQDAFVGTIVRSGTCLHHKDFLDPAQSLADPERDQKEGNVVFVAYGVEKTVIRAFRRVAVYSLARDPIAVTAYSASCWRNRKDTC